MVNNKSQADKQDKNNKNVNKHFYQFNTQVTPELLYKLAERPLSIKILAVILYSANELGAVIIQQKYIRKAVAKRAKEANRSSVSSAINYLRSLGVLAISKIGTFNAYIINPEFIWRLPYNKRNYILKNKHIHFDVEDKDGNNKLVNDVRSIDNSDIKNKLQNARYNARPLITRDLSHLTPIKSKESYYTKEKKKARVKNNKKLIHH